jgi:hypothetical protein
MKTSELTGAALDWAVAKAWQHVYSDRALLQAVAEGYKPSTDWSQGGPIIEREGISIARRGKHSWSEWGAVLNDFEFDEEGPTPLIAAMRCYVASKMGDEIDVPAELTKD